MVLRLRKNMHTALKGYFSLNSLSYASIMEWASVWSSFSTCIAYRRSNERKERPYFTLQACTWFHYCCKSLWNIFQLLYSFLPGKNTCNSSLWRIHCTELFQKILFISFARFPFSFLVPSIRKVLQHSKNNFVCARSLIKRPI